MQCPYCGHQDTSVTNSRPSKNSSIWRRRKCSNCKAIFTTYETTDLSCVLSIKSDKSKKLRPYSRAKLNFSLLRACEHLLDEQSLSIDYLAGIVEHQALKQAKQGILLSIDMKNIISTVLKRFNTVAFIKYNSAHGLETDNFIRT